MFKRYPIASLVLNIRGRRGVQNRDVRGDLDGVRPVHVEDERNPVVRIPWRAVWSDVGNGHIGLTDEPLVVLVWEAFSWPQNILARRHDHDGVGFDGRPVEVQCFATRFRAPVHTECLRHFPLLLLGAYGRCVGLPISRWSGCAAPTGSPAGSMAVNTTNRRMQPVDRPHPEDSLRPGRYVDVTNLWVPKTFAAWADPREAPSLGACAR